MPNLDIGKQGLEKSFNPVLVGKAGQRGNRGKFKWTNYQRNIKNR